MPQTSNHDTVHACIHQDLPDADDVRRLGALKWCAVDFSSRASRAVSFITFFLLGLAVPLANFFCTHSGSSVTTYVMVQLSESTIAGIALFTLSAIYHHAAAGGPGLPHPLLRDDAPTVRHSYARELDRTYQYLAYIFLPCFAVELAHKIPFLSSTSVQVHTPFLPQKLHMAQIMLVAMLVAWGYRTFLFLFVCVLFKLTCELQILRLEEFRKGLEQGIESDAGVIFLEHSRITKKLRATSHRYRIFIIGCLVTISITQLGALMLVLSPKSHNNFFNSGDLVVIIHIYMYIVHMITLICSSRFVH